MSVSASRYVAHHSCLDVVAVLYHSDSETCMSLRSALITSLISFSASLAGKVEVASQRDIYGVCNVLAFVQDGLATLDDVLSPFE